MINIIIPYYKLTFFKETLESLSKQTDKRFKVYIGDDASPEDPTKLIESYRGQFDFEYKKFETNLGSISLVQHWERCINLAPNYDWIMILGDDDVLSENVIEEFYKNLNEINNLAINVVKFSTAVIDELNKPITKVFKSNKSEKSTDAFYNKISDISRSSLSEHIFRKSVYEEHKFQNYSLAWHSDDMAWLEFTNFKNIYCINSATMTIRVSNNSISGMESNINEKVEGSYQFYADLTCEYLDKFNWKQRNLIIRIFESKIFLVKGKSFENYIKIAKLFLGNLFIFSYLKFTFRFLFKHKNI
mgnify:CR=1 FL=1